MSELQFKEDVELCKDTLKEFLEHHYAPSSTMCLTYQFACHLATPENEEQIDYNKKFLSIDDALGPQLNEVAERALLDIVGQRKVYENKVGRFYICVKKNRIKSATKTRDVDYFLPVFE
jgi:hypothetical protein